MKTKTWIGTVALVLAVSLALPALAKGGPAGGGGGHHSNFAATPAEPATGPGTRATPAMPGNPTAQEEVKEHRPDMPGNENGRGEGKGKKKGKGHTKKKHHHGKPTTEGRD